jgi:hypothetical protein
LSDDNLIVVALFFKTKQMAKYKIIPIKHLIKNNKMAQAGDIVDGSQFINLQQSLDGGYCKPVKGKKDKKSKKDKNKDQGEAADFNLESEVKKVKKLKKDDLVSYAEENEIEVNADDNKDVILETIIAALEPKETE